MDNFKAVIDKILNVYLEVFETMKAVFEKLLGALPKDEEKDAQ